MPYLVKPSSMRTVTLHYISGDMQVSCGDFKLCGIFLWVSLGPVVPAEQNKNERRRLNIIADHLHHYMVSICRNGNGVLVKEVCHVT